ncbi:uncharacterized protein (DUF342 family) [Desulfohalotomaculum tongense]|uniref:FapA family protein n=1 Tax=Desulforadius tongensis TaxID=1216062 RepID=UPI0019563EE1|nr:FapA family protein [Desulforadius tongensis]MBM7855399.1 uncharacterized protein (DUF342 family) [Desulforadius tongensis]
MVMGTNKITLNEKGKVILPGDLNQHVQLVPHSDIAVTVNGKQVREPVSISGEDNVELAAVKGDQGKITVEISKDRLSAYVTLTPAVVIAPQIEVEYTPNGVTVKVLPQLKAEYPFTTEAIVQALKENGVVYGISREKISSLLKKPSETKTLVAEGTPFKPGVDESVNLLIDTENNNQPEILPDGRVDFRQKRLTSVDIGQVLAVKIPGKPGEPGTGVDGRPIEPPDYKRMELQAGEGTLLQQNGFSVVSTGRGLPLVQRNKNTWIFKVIPVYQVEEVTLSTGNLEFNGDLVVNKDVAEGMSVFAAGDVKIGGSVYGAKIVALGDVIVSKNVISSFVNAGGMSQYLENLKIKFQSINKSLIQLVELVVLLQERCRQLNKEVCLGQLIVGLINKKFSHLPKTINELVHLLKNKKVVVSSEVRNLITELELKFRRLGWLKIKSIEELQQLQQRVSAVMDFLEAQDNEEKGNVTVSYAINSNIEAEGSVYIAGKGCINTNINAKGNVTIDAVFRGGIISCKGAVKINEAGSEMGVKTVIKTGGSPVKIEKAYQNVFITVGSSSKNINGTEYKVYVREEQNQ